VGRRNDARAQSPTIDEGNGLIESMETKGKYTVGTDRDTADTVRTSLARETALHLARVYKKTIYPRPLELEFEVDEVIVEVKVRAKDKESRLDALTSDRSVDA
jgi:hypothetical protein